MTLNLTIKHDGGDDYQAKIEYSDAEDGRDIIILKPYESAEVVLYEGRSLQISEIEIKNTGPLPDNIKPHDSMQFFEYKHLPDHLQEISMPFGQLAQQLDELLPNNPEKSAMMRKLMEAKDCAVRARLFKESHCSSEIV